MFNGSIFCEKLKVPFIEFYNVSTTPIHSIGLFFILIDLSTISIDGCQDTFKDYKWLQDNTRKEGDNWMAIVAKTIHWQLPKNIIFNKLGFLGW